MRFSRFITVAAAAMVALPALASAQASVLNVKPKFTSGPFVRMGPPATPNRPFVGPYESTINGSPFDVFCIDFEHPFIANELNNQPYQAYVLTFDDIVSGATNGSAGITNFQALVRVLGDDVDFGTAPTTASDYLNRLRTTSALAKSFGSAGPTAAWDEIHYAIWATFSDAQVLEPNAGIGTGAGQARALYNSADALSNAPGYDYSDWRIILDARAWDEIDGGEYRQALITSTVPEPGTYALVGFGLVGLFGAARRRKLAAKK